LTPISQSSSREETTVTSIEERKIDDEVLQQILKETEEIDSKDIGIDTIDLDNLIHRMLLDEVRSSFFTTLSVHSNTECSYL
jgi:hypothetical protein